MLGAFGEAPSESRRVPEWMIPIIGWLTVVFFGPIGFINLSKVFDAGIAVRVDQYGMLMPGYGSFPIPWEDFTALNSQNVMGTSLITFAVVPERIESFDLSKRLLWKLNQPFTGMGGSLAINNTDGKHRDLVEAICMFAPPSLTRYL